MNEIRLQLLLSNTEYLEVVEVAPGWYLAASSLIVPTPPPAPSSSTPTPEEA